MSAFLNFIRLNFFFIFLPPHNLEIKVGQAVIFKKFIFIHCNNKFLIKTKKAFFLLRMRIELQEENKFF